MSIPQKEKNSDGKKAYKGLLVIISGPSGAGKGTVIQHLKEDYPEFIYPISHTTREIRPGEKDGEVYHFISKAKFESGIRKGEFLEFARVHKNNYYGTLKKTIVDALKMGKVIIREGVPPAVIRKSIESFLV